MANLEPLRITLVYAPQPRTVLELVRELPAESTVRDALNASGWQDKPEVRELLEKGADAAQLACGVWGRKCSLDHVLHEQDRVELYRPLMVDPKVARRERFERQGSRGVGLFARRNKQR